jgi:hypothetical protein
MEIICAAGTLFASIALRMVIEEATRLGFRPRGEKPLQ